MFFYLLVWCDGIALVKWGSVGWTLADSLLAEMARRIAEMKLRRKLERQQARDMARQAKQQRGRWTNQSTDRHFVTKRGVSLCAKGSFFRIHEYVLVFHFIPLHWKTVVEIYVHKRHIPVLLCHYYGCWWPGDTRSQGINSHGSGLVLIKYSAGLKACPGLARDILEPHSQWGCKPNA